MFIQNNQKIIQCDRCGNNFTTIANLRKHFNKKKTCEPLLKNITIKELKEKYKINKGVYKCENCSKEYKSKQRKNNQRRKA